MRVIPGLITMLGLLLLCGCGGGGGGSKPAQDTPTVSINVDKSSLTLAASGGVSSFQVSANTRWSITTEANWLALSTSNGANNADVEVSAEDNPTAGERQAVLRIASESGEQVVTVSVSQAASVYPNYNTDAIAPDMEGVSSSAAQIASHITLGWNIGNTMEASGGETAWGNPQVTSELIGLVKNSGFNAIRIPVAWDQYANQETAEIDIAWLNRVKEVVQDCINQDLYVMVNIHWDGGWLENNVTAQNKGAVIAKQKAFWQQIATHLREFDEHLMFASANEPNVDTAEQMDVLLAYHQAFVDVVRATGGKNAYRVLVVQGPGTDIQKTHELMTQMPVDTIAGRLMAEVHFYTPYQFTLMTEDADWGNQFHYWGEGNHSATDTDHNALTEQEEQLVDRLFASMKQQFVDEGIPVVIGEYGAIRRNGQLAGDALALHLQSRADWHKYVTEQALANGLMPFFWDSGGLDNFSFGIFNRTDLTVFDQQTLDALLEGAGQQTSP